MKYVTCTCPTTEPDRCPPCPTSGQRSRLAHQYQLDRLPITLPFYQKRQYGVLRVWTGNPQTDGRVSISTR